MGLKFFMIIRNHTLKPRRGEMCITVGEAKRNLRRCSLPLLPKSQGRNSPKCRLAGRGMIADNHEIFLAKSFFL